MVVAAKTLPMKPKFINKCAAMISSIPKLEFISAAPNIPSNASPTKKGGSRNGTRVIAETRRAVFWPNDLSQFPNGIPKATDSNELATAMIEVVEISSRLVVKNV
jgi:hypothetical protein